MERDLDLVVHLDRLGFEEAWIGEHHSAGSMNSGGFGTFLIMSHEWADTEATRRSYELFARYEGARPVRLS